MKNSILFMDSRKEIDMGTFNTSIRKAKEGTSYCLYEITKYICFVTFVNVLQMLTRSLVKRIE